MSAIRSCSLAAAAIAACGLWPTAHALAQDAAESAIILSGTAQTGSAQRSLGRAVGGSVGNAANAVGGVRSTSRQPSTAPARRNSVQRSQSAIPAGVDPLANTDAATYALDNGATIKVSGRFNPATSAQCERNCPAPPQGKNPPQGERAPQGKPAPPED